jgi:hypothetical protein
MFNAGRDSVDFELPIVSPGVRWHLAVDTSRETPGDSFGMGEKLEWEYMQIYRLHSRAAAIFLAHAKSTGCN